MRFWNTFAKSESNCSSFGITLKLYRSDSKKAAQAEESESEVEEPPPTSDVENLDMDEDGEEESTKPKPKPKPAKGKDKGKGKGSGGITVPEYWPWEEAKKIFQKPDVLSADEVEVRRVC